MKIKSTLLLIIALAVGILLGANKIMSNSSTPQNGHTGDPNDNGGAYCTSCHSGGATCSPIIAVTDTFGNAVSAMLTNTVYEITFSLATPARGGFQCTTDDGNGIFIGSFTRKNTTTEQISVSGSRQYIEHKNAGPSINSWVFRWTAPSTATVSQVSFYFGYVCGLTNATGSGTSSSTSGTTSVSFPFSAPCLTTTSTLNQKICQGDSFYFKGAFQKVTTTIKDTITNLAGCDSIMTLHLAVANPSASSVTATICGNHIYTLHNGTTLNQSGTYTDTIQNHAGCDSVITLTLNVKNISSKITNQTICDNHPYSFHHQQLNTTGTYYDTLIAANGCDSLLILNLTALTTSSSNFNDTTCSNHPYSFGGKLRSISGSYNDTIQNYLGCDSIIILNLFVKTSPVTTLNQNLCFGDSVIFKGLALKTGGTYYDTLIAANNCDSTVVLHLQLAFPSSISISQNLCTNTTYNFNGTTLSSSGTYYDTIKNYLGCDSIIILNLTAVDSSSSVINQTICSNHPYFFNNQMLNSTGTYYDTLSNHVGCDSIIILNLNVLNSNTTLQSTTICSNQPILFAGKMLNVSGIFYDTLQNYLGCDSLISLNLTVNQAKTKILHQNICAGDSFMFKGIAHYNGGTFYDTLSTFLNCDSVIALVLNVYTPSSSIINQTICSNTFISFHHQLINTAGTYFDTIPNYGGCDSMITLNLAVLNASSHVIYDTTCSNQPISFNHHLLNSSGNYYDTLKNYLGCDSLIILHLKVYGTSGSTKNISICKGQHITFNNQILNATGTYFDTLKNHFGCDSLITLHLSVLNNTSKNINTTICAGDSVIFKSHALKIGGTYFDTLKNHLGCDSLVTLHLNVLHKSFYAITQSICGGQSYPFNGHNLSVPGIYYDTLQNYLGCDSLIILHLQAGTNSFSNISQSICNGQFYTFKGKNLTTSGVYYDTIFNTGGCNTLITLTLTVLNNTTNNINRTMCNGQIYNFYGQNLTASGTYAKHFINHLGCDSAIILTLNVTIPNVNVSQVDTTLSSLATNSTYQWVTCNGLQNQYHPIAGAVNSTFNPDSTGWYAVIITTNGCSDTSVCYFVLKQKSMGVDNVNLTNAVQLYPIPTENILNIKWQAAMNVQKIYLQNELGEMLMQSTVQGTTKEISLEKFPAGIYFLHLIGNNEKVMKVIKE